jgi:hypothetical protein
MQVKNIKKRVPIMRGARGDVRFFCSLTKYFILSANSLLAWGLVLVSTTSTSTSTSTSTGTKYSSKKADDTSRYPSRPCLMLFDHVHLWTNPNPNPPKVDVTSRYPSRPCLKLFDHVLAICQHLWTNPKHKNKLIHY